MRIQNSLVIFSLYSLSFVFSKQTVTDGKDLGTIISANVLFRHGHRTPTECYPNDPYNNLTYWPDGWGQLTNIGKMQQYELGKWLRERYNHLLSDVYSRDEIHIRSTDVDRTLMSAEANLAGLYPPKDPQVWSPNIKWQPIPVHTAPEHLDDLLAMGKPCKRYQAEYKKVMSLEPVVDFFEANSELLDYLTTHTGLHVSDLGQALNLWSTMYIETLRNYTLPEWTSKIFPEPLKTVAAHHYTFETYTTELKKLKSGPLLKDMLEHFKVRLGVSEITLPIEEMALMKSRKVYIYSGHDETIGTLLSSLGIFNMKNPPFASAVLVELRERDHAHFVTVTFRNSTEAHLLAIPGCSKLCPYERFIELTANIIPFDWEAECSRSHIFDLTTELPYNSLAVFVMVTSTLLVFLLLASMSIFWQKQKPTRLYKKLKTDSI